MPDDAEKGPVFPAGVTVVAKDTTTSTNEDARELAARGAPHLTLVWAERQEGGRGRSKRRWLSPAGNVSWSLLLRPEPDWPDIAQLAHVTALAVHAALRPHVPPQLPVTLKWPNDTLIGGRKVSGVLIEAGGVRAGPSGRPTADWIVVGVGVNVAHHPTEGLTHEATSLRAEGATVDRDQVLGDLTRTFVALLERWTAEGFGSLREEYLERAHGIGEWATVRFSLNPLDAISGVHEGVDEGGRLLLRLDGGALRTISAGDVFFPAPGAPPGEASPGGP